jgi:hypothetical protein
METRTRKRLKALCFHFILYKARKGEPVSSIGDGAEMRKVNFRGISGCFYIRPAEIISPAPFPASAGRAG